MILLNELCCRNASFVGCTKALFGGTMLGAEDSEQ